MTTWGSGPSDGLLAGRDGKSAEATEHDDISKGMEGRERSMPENCYYQLLGGGCDPKVRSAEGVALQCGTTVGQPQETWGQQTLQPFPMVIIWVLPAL